MTGSSNEVVGRVKSVDLAAGADGTAPAHTWAIISENAKLTLNIFPVYPFFGLSL
jgi:hypothetical protein